MPGTVTPLVLMFTSVILTYVLPSCSWRFGVLDRGHTCVLSDCMRWLYPEDPYGILVRSRKVPCCPGEASVCAIDRDASTEVLCLWFCFDPF